MISCAQGFHRLSWEWEHSTPQVIIHSGQFHQMIECTLDSKRRTRRTRRTRSWKICLAWLSSHSPGQGQGITFCLAGMFPSSNAWFSNTPTNGVHLLAMGCGVALSHKGRKKSLGTEFIQREGEVQREGTDLIHAQETSPLHHKSLSWSRSFSRRRTITPSPSPSLIPIPESRS